MNNRQKLGYMALGAWILAIGMAIGQFITPNIEAQHNGVFDTVMCSKLFVKNIGDDMSGVYLTPTSVMIARGADKAIELQCSEDQQNEVVIYNPKTGERFITMGSHWERNSDTEVAGVFLWDRRDANSISVSMLSTDEANEVTVVNPQTGKKAVGMKSVSGGNSVYVYNQGKRAIDLSSVPMLGNSLVVSDKQENPVAGVSGMWLSRTPGEGSIWVTDKQSGKHKRLEDFK